MLINISNHPFHFWDPKQRLAAEEFGECLDLPFPSIDPKGGEPYIENLAEEYRQQILTYHHETITVHLMGEMTFVYSLLEKLKKDDIRCIASTTERISRFSDDGLKETQFAFVRFRNYFNPTLSTQ